MRVRETYFIIILIIYFTINTNFKYDTTLRYNFSTHFYVHVNMYNNLSCSHARIYVYIV
jgi:hypothetical protein